MNNNYYKELLNNLTSNFLINMILIICKISKIKISKMSKFIIIKMNFKMLISFNKYLNTNKKIKRYLIAVINIVRLNSIINKPKLINYPLFSIIRYN